MSDLGTQLREDGVAFLDLPVEPDFEAKLRAELPEGTGFIVAPPGGGTPAELRDVAQEALNDSGLTTVVARSPEAVAAVSVDYDRVALESAQRHLLMEPDYVLGLREFSNELGSFSLPWGLILAVIVLVIAGIAAWTWQSVKVKG